jgi:HK97 family phage major capsid protein
MNKLNELRQKRAEKIASMRTLTDSDAMTDEQAAQFDALQADVDKLDSDITRLEKVDELERSAAQPATRASKPGAPMVNRSKPGETEASAVAHYVRTGDYGAVRELRASNDTDMNIGTPADGGYSVPTGHYNNIIAKRDAGMLANVLGVMRIPGSGTTTNVPVDNGTANVFVSTNEAANFDRDAPVLGQAAMTLVKYTKKIQLSLEVLQDEDSRLLQFVENYVGRAMALTHNALLVTEALANGTSVNLAAAAAATTTDVQTLVYTIKGEYGDNAQWVMKRATEGSYRKLTTTDWAYAPMPSGDPAVPTLWGYPVRWSDSVAAIGAGNKSLIFGNFEYMGLYESPSITFLRDPYGAANSGQVNLYYYFRAVYKVLLAEAILYGKHPTA